MNCTLFRNDKDGDHIAIIFITDVSGVFENRNLLLEPVNLARNDKLWELIFHGSSISSFISSKVIFSK